MTGPLTREPQAESTSSRSYESRPVGKKHLDWQVSITTNILCKSANGPLAPTANPVLSTEAYVASSLLICFLLIIRTFSHVPPLLLSPPSRWVPGLATPLPLHPCFSSAPPPPPRLAPPPMVLLAQLGLLNPSRDGPTPLHRHSGLPCCRCYQVANPSASLLFCSSRTWGQPMYC